jgi:hypothetical protein
MTVGELIENLSQFNPKADVEMAPWGDSMNSAVGRVNGVVREDTPMKCETVFLEIDLDLN